mmetsp:Transcript_7388/g.8456  ORF Transcript_7388/g.8456 Transcript_7388/m.8456 type:complete len:263 (+) Transcript_7388:97-885(+)
MKAKSRVPPLQRVIFGTVVCFCVIPRIVAAKNEVVFDEDALVQETIEAGRGERDEQGIRDQWQIEEHVGSTFDSRQPISADVQRLLKAYRLTCEGCDQNKAVRTVNAYIKETKRLVKKERESRQRRDAWARKICAALVVVGLSYAYVHRKRLGLEELLLSNDDDNDNFQGFTETHRANILRLQREQAADAAAKRHAPPTWVDNEKKEVWKPKQEKQFQKALKEFYGVNKKERYNLIAAKVVGKSRVECMLHHRMQELLEQQK